MTALDFFRHPDIQLPLSRQTEFSTFVKGVFEKYLTLVKSLNTDDPIANAIRQDEPEISFLCRQLMEALTAYHSGWPAKAYKAISEGIEKIWPRIEKLRVDTPDQPQYKEMYRLRIAGPEGGAFQKRDLFHIPFDKRHIVKRQRYSIPGLPCLYLGTTLHVCWLEMGRPDFNSLYVARYERAEGESLRLLDLSESPTWVASRIALPKPPAFLRDFCVAVAACWPLMAMCSVQRMCGEAPFIEEYIIPQLVLQWVTERDWVDGIQYFSVKLAPRPDSPFATVNLVFPARETTPEGICAKLRRKLILTEPASWQLLAPMASWAESARRTPQHDDMRFELVRGQFTRYAGTEFGLMEAKMVNIPCGPL